MTSELTCPNCNREARFREVYGPDDSLHLECTLCGKPTDDAELALAQPVEGTHASDCAIWVNEQCGCETNPEVIQ